MKRFSRSEWLASAIGFSLGFILCLIGIGFWPAGTDEKHEYGANYPTEGNSTYYKISKTWEEWREVMFERTSEDPVAFYTLVLGGFTAVLGASTIGLWLVTARIASEANDSAKTLISMERPYVTGGGDFENEWGKELFRLDVENHGKTAAFMTGYDLQFAKLGDLQKDHPKVKAVCENKFRHIDGISPQGARKAIRTQKEKPWDDDVVFGAIFYRDIFNKRHSSRFILRIAPWRDIPGEGLTRLDVKGVSSEYWSWDIPENEQT